MKALFKKWSLYDSRFAVTVFLAALFLIAGGFVQNARASAYDVTIGGGTSSNGAWSGGNPDVYTPNAPEATVAAADIVSRLNAGTSVTITTSAAVSGNGDILVNDSISWSANTTLTLSAYRNVNVNSNITATGNTAGLVLTPDTCGAACVGTYSLNNGAVITLSGSAPGLTIAGNPYTVINEANGGVTALQNMSGNLAGRYALGSNINATATSTWNVGLGFAPVGDLTTNFTGTFDGLGHTITGLFIVRPAADYVGLFGYKIGAAISNVGLVDANITGLNYAGVLAGYNTGTISNSYSTGSVTGSSSSNYVGGLMGYNTGAYNYKRH